MRQQPGFHAFFGIDQTGAVVPGSGGMRARPLHWALVIPQKKGASLHVPQAPLEHLAIAPLHAELARATPRVMPDARIMVLADCVLGLPSIMLPFQEALARLARPPESAGPWGREPAEKFFSGILAEHGKASPLPTRLCEEWARANSVFRARPYQKNIQTGTYRIWRNLAGDPQFADWHLWPFSRTTGSWNLMEGYPSLMWNRVAGFRNRTPQELGSWLAQQQIRFSREDEDRFCQDANLADAVMLAAAGWILHERNRLLEPFPGFFESATYRERASCEGWIAGLESPV